MSKELDNETELERRINILREKGYKEAMIKLIQSSVRLQAKFLPLDSIIGWLDEQISRVKPSSDSKNNRI